MKAKRKSDDQQKQCIRVTQFKYEQGLRSSSLKKSSMLQTFERQSPLKILAKKMSLTAQNVQNKEKKNTFFNESQLRTFIAPRDSMYEPKRYVFNRYNYQNYNNYEYKNPFKPKKYPIDDKLFEHLKNNPTKGTTKNLQIVFCQRKYKDFVDKSNANFQKFYETSRQIPAFQSPHGRKTKNRITKHQSQPKIAPATFYQTKKRKTTLSKYLHQFVTLQKLSEYMQREHKMNEKYLLHSSPQISQTVLLDIVIYRFQFLKKIKKKARDIIFKTLLGEDALSPISKISIKQYIRFVQLFISRDADNTSVAMFMFNFLFRSVEDVSVQKALTSLDLLQSTANKHQIVQDRLIPILEQNKGHIQKIFQQMLKDQFLLHSFIDLIVSNN